MGKLQFTVSNDVSDLKSHEYSAITAELGTALGMFVLTHPVADSDVLYDEGGFHVPQGEKMGVQGPQLATPSL